MKLFNKKSADELSSKIQGLIDEFDDKVNDYEFVSEKIDRRDEMADNLLLSAGLTLIGMIPTGMLIGAAYMGSIGNGGMIGAILPVGLGVGAGIISYLNHRDNKQLVNNPDLDKPMQSIYNEKHGKDLLQKLGELEIGESFKDVKKIIEDSIKNPPYHQENIGNEIRNTLRKNNL